MGELVFNTVMPAEVLPELLVLVVVVTLLPREIVVVLMKEGSDEDGDGGCAIVVVELVEVAPVMVTCVALIPGG